MKFLYLIIALLTMSCAKPPIMEPFKIYTPKIETKEVTMEKVPTFVKWKDFSVTRDIEDQKVSFIYFHNKSKESNKMNVTLSNPQIVEILNQNYDCYKFDLNNNINELEAKLLGVTSAPSILLIYPADNSKESLILEHNGYLRSSELVQILEAFDESNSVTR